MFLNETIKDNDIGEYDSTTDHIGPEIVFSYTSAARSDYCWLFRTYYQKAIIKGIITGTAGLPWT